MSKDSVHTQAVGRAVDDMHKVIGSMTDAPFMDKATSPDAARRQTLFESMAPDLKTLLDGGTPAYLVEKLARADQES